jgi:hypothetical protein
MEHVLSDCLFVLICVNVEDFFPVAPVDPAIRLSKPLRNPNLAAAAAAKFVDLDDVEKIC